MAIKEVSPPLIEYEKNFKYFLDTTIDENIFRLVDPISNQANVYKKRYNTSNS